ncbi:MAG: 3-oxoadipate enol-lactonase [Actinomycetota bacterium]
MSEGRPEPRPALRLTASLTGPAGAPVLVLGNSIGTTRALWDRQAAVLGRHFRLLRFEHPGHGGSPAPPGPYSIGDLADGVLALLDERQIAKAAYCGISLGGMVGMWLAANAPDRITRLGLCCTSAYLDLAWAERAALVRSAGMGPIADVSPARWFTAAFRCSDPATVDTVIGEMRQVTPEGYAACCDAIGAMDQRDSLASVTAPTLVISGAQDPATPPWHGAVIAARIGSSRLRVIHGASHLANVSHPGEFTALLLGHLLAGS